MSRSQILYKRAKAIIPGVTQLLSKRPDMFLPGLWPTYYQKAKGCKVWDIDGKEYIDVSLMGVGTAILGYSYPYVDKAVKSAVDNANMTTLNCVEEIKLAEKLCEIHPWAQMVRFARTGGESAVIAIRIARAYTGKDVVMFCGYHGWHDWYLSANLSHDKALDGHLLPGLEPKGVPRSLKGTAVPFKYNNVKDFISKFKKIKDKVAAVIMEPVRNYYPEEGFLETIREYTKRNDVPLIMDEITAGWRLCLGGAHMHFGIKPDIAIFAKAVSNGYPMAAIIGRKKIMNSVQDTFISSTYWSERIGPTAALATIDVLEQKNVVSFLTKTGKAIKRGLLELSQKHNLDIKVYGISPLLHFSFEYRRAMEIKTLFTQKMLEKGFLATTLFYVSFAHKPQIIKQYLNAVDDVFKSISRLDLKKSLSKYLKTSCCRSGFKRLN